MGFLLDLTIAQIDIMRLDTVERKQLEAFDAVVLARVVRDN
jgi:hypothetical protein